MIILIDNKNFMIRLCEDSKEYHGFDTSFPGWKGWAQLLSDAGAKVLLSGSEAEKFLDENNIYYVHVEQVAKESFFKFERRLNRLVKENQKYLDTSMSFGKLVFSVTEDGKEGTVNTYNLSNIWRLNEDNRYYIDVNIDLEASRKERIAQALVIEKAVAEVILCKDLEELSEEVDEIVADMIGEDIESLFSADTFREALLNTLAICEIMATSIVIH